MLRFIKHHLASESGVEFYGIFSLMIFVLFFLVVLIRIWKMNKSAVEELSNIPLSSDNLTSQNEKL
ncbi:cbb3-type cytochrome c oxidase subunit 3 [Fluviicola chungangensis]|uniref:Cbb3-type cytochrome c oxidase subunit 3 n=1 Tax=Fluviicola chungangensis TaxID=2597671 RepID=A0A556MYN7_9FLAO|nr:cbb3-type cytochrome c oxidase subunit 3 [Fluviicola chungangensis]TSJ44953.1 cbb3-type cytochrome c oxidase subunit 3 [Fluviicola chungangensis]